MKTKSKSFRTKLRTCPVILITFTLPATANLADYTTDDDFLSKHFDFDDELSSFYHQKAALEKLGIEVNRKSMDNKRNNNGFKLLDICKNNNLSIWCRQKCR